MVMEPSEFRVVDPPQTLGPVSSHFGVIGLPAVSQSLFSVKCMGPIANSSQDLTLYTSSVASAQLKLRPWRGQLSFVSCPVAKFLELVSNVPGAVRLKIPCQLS